MRPRRSRLVVALSSFLTVFVVTPCHASKDPANSIASGAFALQFLTFGGGWEQPFNNSGIYMKWHLSDRGALRAGTSFNLDQSSSTNPLVLYAPQANDRSYNFTVTAEYEYYADESGPVTFAVGFGPYWSRSRSFFERTQLYTSDPNSPWSYTRDDSHSWVVGGAASAGFEWFFRRKLSLLGRIGASFGFGEAHQVHNDRYFDGTDLLESRSRRDATTSTAGTSSAALGISVYL